ncbi:protein NO VEIN domain-containing protein [Streptomyces sp. NBC_00118]|uniref:protein NO VEIN domain-containing protein n=1 Tax=unclassified Streptomyces TaxID=2593676 RepID=UPI003090A562|nr:DUF3883 domain-containing protein [Streptomyces sp. NBC_01397]
MQYVTETTREAAYRWLVKLQESEIRKLRAVFSNSPSYADLTPVQYDQGLAWLRSLGLVTPAGTAAVVLRAKDPSSAEAAVARVLAKRDLEARKATGDAGEWALLALLRAAGAQDVRHVAAESDSYGYDVEATVAGHPLHIECKATTNARQLVVYLSRNEFETMRADPAWAMVALLVAETGQVHQAVTVDRRWLEASAPADTADGVCWESARYVVPPHATAPGIMVGTGRILADLGQGMNGVRAWGRSSGLALLS